MTVRALSPNDVFHLLLGRWHIERTIPGQATMRGQATIRPLPPEPLASPATRNLSSRPKAASRPQWRDLRFPATEFPTALYTEHIQIQTTTGHHLTGTASYLFTHRPAGNLDVHLHTGALFHTLRFIQTAQGHLEAHAVHHCAADIYHSTYRLTSPDHLYIEHHVRGPRKLYTTQTTLDRTHPHPATNTHN